MAAAAVVGVPDDEWGERVVAVVEGDAALVDLRGAVTPRAWAPQRVVHVERSRGSPTASPTARPSGGWPLDA